MIPSVATVTLSGHIPVRMRATVDARLRRIELFDADLDAIGDDRAARRMIADAGLGAASLFPLLDVEGMGAARRREALDRAEIGGGSPDGRVSPRTRAISRESVMAFARAP